MHWAQGVEGVAGCNAGLGGGGFMMNDSILSELQISTSGKVLALRRIQNTQHLYNIYCNTPKD